MIEKMENVTFVTVVVEHHNNVFLQNIEWIISQNVFPNNHIVVFNDDQISNRFVTSLKEIGENSNYRLSFIFLKPNFENPSVSHAHALNLALLNVKTESVLVVDPDFFMKTKEIGRRLVEVDNGEGYLGCGWAPKWYTKKRDWLTPHLMLINLTKWPDCRFEVGKLKGLIAPEELGIVRSKGTESLPKDEDSVSTPSINSSLRQVGLKVPPKLRKFLRRIRLLQKLRIRKSIETIEDTHLVLSSRNQHVARASARAEQPRHIIRLGIDFCKPKSSIFGFWIEKLIPNSFSYWPRRYPPIVISPGSDLDYILSQGELIGDSNSILGLHLRLHGNTKGLYWKNPEGEPVDQTCLEGGIEKAIREYKLNMGIMNKQIYNAKLQLSLEIIRNLTNEQWAERLEVFTIKPSRLRISPFKG